MLDEDEPPLFENPRVSVLDRSKRPGDDLPEHMFRHLPVDRDSVRLALEHDGRKVYIARGINADDLFLINEGRSGGGASGGPFEGLAKYGIKYNTSWGSWESGAFMVGIVPDEVIGVRVDEHHAVMGDNVFIAVLPDGPAVDMIRLTTATGEHEIPLGSPVDL